MRSTDASAGHLAERLGSDILRLKESEAKIKNAEDRLTAAVRDEEVTAEGRRGTFPSGPFTSDYERVPHAYFHNRLHTITASGWATVRPDAPLEHFFPPEFGKDWGDLRFRSNDVLVLVGEVSEGQIVKPEAAILGTGAPGRPTKSMHLVKPELERRHRAGIAHERVADEAKAVLEWLICTHPTAEPPSIKNITNWLSSMRRQLGRVSA